jgi:hypothetical protein
LCNIFVRYFASSYAGAFLQLIIGLIGVFSLCSFIVAWSFGAVGFVFIYFHLFSFGIILLHCVIIRFIAFWWVFVGSLLSKVN